MAVPKVYDRVRDTTSTTGTGTVTLSGTAPSGGYRSFGSVLSSGDQTFYCISLESSSQWEVGLGTYNSSGPTLARTQVLASSNSNGAVDFSAGSKDVFMTGAADHVADRLGIYTPPVDADFSWVNQGVATITQLGKTLHLSAATAGASDNFRMRVKNAPSTPYVITIAWLPIFKPDNYPGGGLFFRESSSGKIHLWALYHESIQTGGIQAIVGRYNDFTTYAGTNDFTGPGMALYVSNPIWMRIADDGTDRIFSFSRDGVNFVTVATVGNTTFLTADQVGFYVNAHTRDAAMTLLSWKET